MNINRGKIKKGIRNPATAVSYISKPVYRNGTVAITSRFPLGTSILSRDWDLLIILDTCRVDALQEVADEYDFIPEVNSVLSVGGSSPEWMAHTFDKKWRESLHDTAYLTANAWAERILDAQEHLDSEHAEYTILERLQRFGKWNVVQSHELGRVERIWKYVATDERLRETHDPDGLMPGGAPPRYVTDRVISVGREFDYDRLISHYMQPHAPYVAGATVEGREMRRYEKQPFAYLRETGQTDTVWNAYLNELRYVLDEVEVLLQNIDAETVVISADHGEAFGEFNIYNHHTGSLHPKIRIVPWVVTSATDTGSYSPQVQPHEQADVDVDDALKALGYL